MHVVPSYLPATRYGGPIQSVHALCRALVREGHQVTVFTTNVDGPGNSDVPLSQAVHFDGVAVWYFPSTLLRRLYWSPSMGRALKAGISSFDIVHLHSVFLWPTWAAARAARKAGVPYMVAPRGMLVHDLIQRKSRWQKKAWIRLIEKRNLENASGIHVTAPLERKEIEQFGFDLPPFYYVPNGIEVADSPDLERASTGLVLDHPYALFLSRINWKKGLDRLIRAWRLVPDTRLIIAGNDDEHHWSEIEKLAKREGVADRVDYLGPVHGTDKWQLYRRAKLFILPSYSENFGIVVLEAMSMACPVIVTPQVGLAGIVEESGCGRVAAGDPDSLAAAVREMLDDSNLRESMGKRGKEWATSRFSWDTVARRMEQAYSAVLEQH